MSATLAPHCDCAECRAAHWVDDDPTIYTAHEVADAWIDGRNRGADDVVRRLITTLTNWLNSEYDPIPGEDEPSSSVEDEGS